MKTRIKKIYYTVLLLLISSSLSYANQNCDNTKDKSTPTERFIINTGFETGTVTDTKTNLMWKTCIEGLYGPNCQQGYPYKSKWRDSFNIAKQSTFATYTDWRIPSKEELNSLVETACNSPAINQDVFLGNNNLFVWTNKQYITRRYYFAWGVDFTSGENYTDFQVANNYVRLVRG